MKMDPNLNRDQTIALLLSSFSLRQLMKIATLAKEVRVKGFGKLVIIFKDHKPRFVETCESEELIE